MQCHRGRTNAPVICTSTEQVVLSAQKANAQLVIVEEDAGLVNIVVDASKSGRWVCIQTAGISNESLREVVYQVWLCGAWTHHETFRTWFVDVTFVPPPKEELLYGFGAPRLETTTQGKHGVTDKELLDRIQESEKIKALPSLLVRSAVFLQYCDSFEEEFKARELIAAVAGSELYGTEEQRRHLRLLRPQDLVDLYRLASREDVMVALTQQGDSDAEDCAYLIAARDRDGRSPLDIAIEKDYKKAAVLLRNLGCKSETFKFDRLLDPNFQPMLKELIDPWKQFPFDPVKSLSKVALAGQGSILRKLFHCRVDVEFGISEYPLAEACESGCDDVAWIVIDRMGATGVSPLQDNESAAFHLVRTLMYLHENPAAGKMRSAARHVKSQRSAEEMLHDAATSGLPQRRYTKSDADPLNETGMWVIHKLADVCLDHGKRFPIPLPALCRAEKSGDLMKKLLQLIDIDAESNLEGLLEFFIFFDPRNELARRLTKKAFTSLGEHSKSVEEDTFQLVWQMIQQGERGEQMAHWGIQLVAFRQYFPFALRGHGGETILMKAGCGKPPNVGAVQSILECVPRSVKERSIEQVDVSGNNVLKRLVVQLCNEPDLYGEYLELYADVTRLLLQHGVSFEVSLPSFSSDLFTMCARQDLGAMCYELLPTRSRKGSIILSCTMNTLALMWRRFLQKKTHPLARRSFLSVFDDGEVQVKKTRDIATDTEADSYVTDKIDVTKLPSTMLTDDEKKEMERFNVDELQAKAPLSDVIDARVEKARQPHPVFGNNILSLLDVNVLSHILTFARVRDVGRVAQVSTSWLYASLFDCVWVNRQLWEMNRGATKPLSSLKTHAAKIAANAANSHNDVAPPPLDFVHASHPLESARSVFMMHVTDMWNQQKQMEDYEEL